MKTTKYLFNHIIKITFYFSKIIKKLMILTVNKVLFFLWLHILFDTSSM
jgi:hypothetical protein